MYKLPYRVIFAGAGSRNESETRVSCQVLGHRLRAPASTLDSERSEDIVQRPRSKITQVSNSPQPNGEPYAT
jgi:hypothetical protein